MSRNRHPGCRFAVMTRTTTPQTGSRSVQAKLSRAAEGRLPPRAASGLHSERLPPGQRLVEEWPVLDLGTQPEIDAADWRLEVSGLVARPLVIDMAALERLERVSAVSDIHCVTGWTRLDNRFGGVASTTLAEAAGVLPQACHVMLYCSDGYSTNLAIGDFLASGAMLATTWQDQPLTAAHGGPVRFLLPHLYLWKSAKWISRIDFRADDEPGFWEAGGYHRRGDPWQEQRFATQADGYGRRDRAMADANKADEAGARAISDMQALEAALSPKAAPRRSLLGRLLGF